MTEFENKVLEKVSQIPRGRLATYKILAQALGRPKAVRAVGNALNKNLNLIKIPCHRVVRSDGRLGGYRSGFGNKLRLLEKEGVKFNGQNKVENLKKFFHNF